MQTAMFGLRRELAPWWAAVTDLAFSWPEDVSADRRAEILSAGLHLVNLWGPTLAKAGLEPGSFLRPESEPGAGDAGVLWKLRPGSVVLGVIGQTVVARGPVGFFSVHVIGADGSVRELRGRPRWEVLDKFRSLAARVMETCNA